MIAYITSSPFVDGASRSILSPANGFLDRIREDLPENPRCLFVASSPEDRGATCAFGAATFSAFADAGIHFSSYQILDAFNAEFAADLIMDSDFIILAGGHVPTQNDFFQEINLAVLLQDYEGVVMGISAGSMNSAAEVYVQPEEPGESDPDFPRFAPGLGITQVQILPHYQKVKHVILDGLRLFEDITYADSRGHTFFALPDGSYFYVRDGQTWLCGKGYRLRDGHMERVCRFGEVKPLEQLW